MHRAIVAIGRNNGRIYAIELKDGRHAASFLGPVISRAPRNIMTPTSMVTQRNRRVQSVLTARRIKSNNQTARPKHQSSSKIDTD
jgi:hypothetical protein